MTLPGQKICVAPEQFSTLLALPLSSGYKFAWLCFHYNIWTILNFISRKVKMHEKLIRSELQCNYLGQNITCFESCVSLTAPSALEGTKLPALWVGEIHKIFRKEEWTVISISPQAKGIYRSTAGGCGPHAGAGTAEVALYYRYCYYCHFLLLTIYLAAHLQYFARVVAIGVQRLKS